MVGSGLIGVIAGRGAKGIAGPVIHPRGSARLQAIAEIRPPSCLWAGGPIDQVGLASIGYAITGVGISTRIGQDRSNQKVVPTIAIDVASRRETLGASSTSLGGYAALRHIAGITAADPVTGQAPGNHEALQLFLA